MCFISIDFPNKLKPNHLFSSEIDLFVGTLLDENNVKRDNLLVSRPYFYDRLTWCVQKSQSREHWKQIFYVITDNWTRLLIVLTFFVVILIIYFIQLFDRYKMSTHAILIMGIAFVLSIPYKCYPLTMSHRMSIFFSIFGCFTIATIVSSSAFRTTTNSYYLKTQVESIDEITTNDFKLVGDRFALQQLYLQSDVSLMSALHFPHLFCLYG